MEERNAGAHRKAKSLNGTQAQEVLAESLFGENIDGNVPEAWEVEIARRVSALDSGKAKTVTWREVRRRNSAKLPDGR